MTLAEKHAVTRFKTYLLITGNDVERALAIQKKFAPQDLKHEKLLREIVKGTK